MNVRRNGKSNALVKRKKIHSFALVINKKGMKNLIIAVALLIGIPLMAQTKVVKKNAVKANNFGITYSLPKTSLVVEAEVALFMTAPSSSSIVSTPLLSLATP